jgi:hypothetical protein
MAHLNLYLPDDIAEVLKQEASSARLPLSRYVLSLLVSRGPGAAWPSQYFERECGFLSEEMAEPEDAPPEPLDELDPRR